MSSSSSSSSSEYSASSSSQELVIFSHYNPFVDALQLEERHFSFFDSQLRVRQAWTPGGKGGTDIGFGASVYDASIVLSYYLESQPMVVRDKFVLELGCGPGLVSLVAALAGAQCVVMTDGDPMAVDLAGINKDQNLNLPNMHVVNPMKLLWGEDADIEGVRSVIHNATGGTQQHPDIILASDVAALPYAEAYSALIQTLRALTSTVADTQSKFILCYQRRHASEDKFFHMLRKYFYVIKLSDEAVQKDFRNLPISLYEITPRT